MVFESIVVELVNKYLGDFIENLDKSQLKIGLWGGDVVLNNLYVKESALDDLDLPVKVLYGNIGKLVLKVPWKNLYTEPTVADLDGLYVVAVPNLGVKYDAEKEAKNDFEKKQKELARIEEVKQAEANKGKEKEEKADTFAEKLATNIIKNLQVNVKNVHIRFEDHFTNPKRPFSIGVTLESLAFQTTDENWKPKTIKEDVSMIYKIIQLNCLSVYWNTDTQSFLRQDRETLLNSLKGNIASDQHKPKFQYLIEPIRSSAQLTIHTKPEKDQFSLPKLLLNVIFQEIGVALNRKQYHDIMELLESFERMSLASLFRKYDRPSQSIKGHASQWWKYAYRSVVGETVKRRRIMWSWNHIKAHRQLLRDYKELYKKKLLSKKLSADMQKQLEGMEKELSIFNITMIRQRADMETKSKREKQAGGGGWFGGWFGGGKSEKKEEDIAEQFNKAMTPEEKAKLYDAIGYQESTADLSLPKDYVAHKLSFKLGKLSLKLRDTDRSEPQVVNVQLEDVFASVGQRPAANALKVDAKMDSFTVLGCPVQGGGVPSLVSSQNKKTQYSLLDLLFEINPLDGKADTRVNVNARPLEIIYDAHTINQVAEFFKPPEAVYLTQIQAAAFAKFEELREQTATGLQHAIEQHKFTDINVDLQPSYVIIPDKGVYRSNATMVVLDLGNFKVNSEKQEIVTVSPSGEQMKELKKLNVDEIMKKAYDKFNIKLARVQLIFAKAGEDWKAGRKSVTHMHILKPMDLNIGLYKSMLQDVKLPKKKKVPTATLR